MSSLKSISDLCTYPFEVQAGIAPNLYALFERATMIQDELPQEHPGVNDESILILAQAMIHAHISSSAITVTLKLLYASGSSFTSLRVEPHRAKSFGTF